MATNLSTSNHVDEDYIDMEVSSCSSLLCSSTNSSPQSREFEFQMSTISNEKDTTTSPADELFYKGKLLPLHLPPRIQMVEKLLQSSTTPFEKTKEAFEEEQCSMRFVTSSTAPSTNTSSPLDSCNISPSESCRVSCDLNPDEYYFEWTTELSSFIDNQPKKTWSKKLKLIKDSSIGQKLKASRAYLRSLFNKSACSDESSAKAAGNVEAEKDSKVTECSNKYIKVAKKTSFGHIGKGPYPTIGNIMKSIDKEENEENLTSHRRSFSRALKRHSPTKCLSSSSGSGSGSGSSSSSSGSSSSSSSVSLNANGFCELQFLKRSSSDTTEIESSIQAAIAHCKKSQQPVDARSKISEAGSLCSFSASKIAPSQDQDRPGVCKI